MLHHKLKLLWVTLFCFISLWICQFSFAQPASKPVLKPSEDALEKILKKKNKNDLFPPSLKQKKTKDSPRLDEVLGIIKGQTPIEPTWVKTGIPPEGYAEFEVVDRSVGLRDDYIFLTQTDDRGVVWSGGMQGRIFKSTDRGMTWTSALVIPEQKNLYAFNMQSILFGALRSNPHIPNEMHELGGVSYLGPQRDFNAFGPQIWDDLKNESMFDAAMDVPANFVLNPLEGDSVNQLYGRGGLLGAGLSSRAPRLSLFLRILERPIANISLQRMLVDTGKRFTFINRFLRHPNGTMFAATTYGLYESTDDGVRWMRIFPGLTIKEKKIWDVSIDWKDPNRMYISTGMGMYLSNDAGRSWIKSTQVPEIEMYKVTVDPKDSNYVYAAGDGGVYRSNDRAQTFVYAYFHSIPKRRLVSWIQVDPFDSNRAFLGTADGIMTTENLKDSTSQDWYIANSLRTASLKCTLMVACKRHPGHWYAQTRAALPDINYRSNGPENLALETWDYGKSFRELSGNRTFGDLQFIWPDDLDPDSLWISFTRAMSFLRRKKNKSKHVGEVYDEFLYPGDPTVGELILAALDAIDLRLDDQQHNLDRLKYRNLIPNKVTLSFEYAKFGLNNVYDQIQYLQIGPRLLGDLQISEWRFMGYASWAFPEIFLNGIYATPMLRYRVLMMDEEVRETVMNRIHRNYAEYQRLKARMSERHDDDLLTRATNTIRLEYLLTVVDLTTAGYLSRWLGKVNR